MEESLKVVREHKNEIDVLKGLGADVDQVKGSIAADLFIPSLREALHRRNPLEARSYYEQLHRFKPDVGLSPLLIEISNAILSEPDREHRGYAPILLQMLKDAQEPLDIITARYLVLANGILVDDVPDDLKFGTGHTFATELSTLERSAKSHRGVIKQESCLGSGSTSPRRAGNDRNLSSAFASHVQELNPWGGQDET